MSTGLRGKHTVIKVDDNGGSLTDLSEHIVEFSGLPQTYDEIEDSGYGQDHSTLKGQGDSTVTIKFKFNDTVHAIVTHPTTGAINSDTARTIQAEYGENAAPTTGDLKISGEYNLVSAEIETAKGDQRLLNTTWRLQGGVMPAYGTV